jgi:hypothetical protein
MKRHFIIVKVGTAPDRSGASLYQIFYEIADDVYEMAGREQLRDTGYEKNEPLPLTKALLVVRKLREDNK